jgi:hypothetical protein
MYRKKRGAYSDGERRPPGITRRRFQDIIKMDLQEVGYVCMDWIDLTQDKGRWRTVVNSVMNRRVT